MEVPVSLSALEYASFPGPAQLAEKESAWVEMEVTVGSGACDTVMPLSACDFQILPSYQSRNKMAYEVANGESIPNRGGRPCVIRTPGWLEREEHHVSSC